MKQETAAIARTIVRARKEVELETLIEGIESSVSPEDIRMIHLAIPSSIFDGIPVTIEIEVQDRDMDWTDYAFAQSQGITASVTDAVKSYKQQNGIMPSLDIYINQEILYREYEFCHIITLT